ncbi:hypothetical protein TNCV_4548521 [Trichonephila clavipes]|nr:hypothetical protein TNCV_4548521 [Trichonephila clavipes]
MNKSKIEKKLSVPVQRTGKPVMDRLRWPVRSTGKPVKEVLDESRSFFRVHTGYFSNIRLRLRELSPEFGLLKENSRKRTKMPTEQEANPAVVTPSLQPWRSPSTFRGAPEEEPSQMA